MSKAKALGLALLFSGLTLSCILTQQSDLTTYTPCISGFTFMALVFGCVSGYKYYRDHAIIQRAREVSGLPARIEPPAMTSPGSSRLFVPDPLDRR